VTLAGNDATKLAPRILDNNKLMSLTLGLLVPKIALVLEAFMRHKILLFLFAFVPFGALAQIDRVMPDVLRLNSTIVVHGNGFKDEKGQWNLVLSGTLYVANEEKKVSFSLPLVRVNNKELRAPLTREFVDNIGLDGGVFEGVVKVVAPSASFEKQVKLTIFPKDILWALVKIVGFASPTSTLPPLWALIVAYVILALFILLAVFSLFAGVASYAERRIAGRMQNRIGPNRVGPQGFFQWIADGVKCLLKEDFIPPKGLKLLFRVGPYFPMIGVVLTLVTLPFGQFLVVSDLNVGVYYVFAVTGFTVVGILIGGFASANKWALLGAFRSAAQIVSYEIPSGLAVATIVVVAGSLGFSTIIERQGGFPWEWYLFNDPFTFMAFFLFFVASLAEGNRTPFDLPEAESELVAGYNTEYSGMRFVFYLFAEWGNLYIMGALVTALFLGGWQIPGVSYTVQAQSPWLIALGWLIFTLKALFIVFVVIWLRWTLPRIRIDQLMVLCWVYLVPAGCILLLGSALFNGFAPSAVKVIVKALMTLFGALVVFAFFHKTYKTLKQGYLEFYPNPFV
jgi:NADH:ubiquinone oxidoreductase subunit H